MKSRYTTMMIAASLVLSVARAASAGPIPLDTTYDVELTEAGWNLGGPANGGFVVHRNDDFGFDVELGLRARLPSSVLPQINGVYTAPAGASGGLALWDFDASVFLVTGDPVAWVDGFAVLNSSVTEPVDTFGWHERIWLELNGTQVVDLQAGAAAWAAAHSYTLEQIVGMQYTGNLESLLGSGFDASAAGDYNFSLGIQSITKAVDMRVQVVPVPVPGAVLLGLFGVGVARLGWRKLS